VALLERVPHFFRRVLAFDELGNVWRDAEADVAHYVLVVIVPVFLSGGRLVNFRLIFDVSIVIGNGRGNVRACFGKDLATSFGYNISVHSFQPRDPVGAIKDRNNVEEY
jgi:hypothetical protein